ncbi:type IV pilus assembly protein PilW [Lysobacter sp. HA35]
MVALLIGAILTIGIVQVFSASRTSYAMVEGMSRVQENARFAVDALQRDLRMVGHYGCVNDQFRLMNTGELNSHFATGGALDFNRSIEGYEATGTGAAGTLNLASPAAGWSPSLPSWLTTLTPAPVPGSDVIVLRYLTPEGIPVTSFGTSGTDVTLSVDSTKWSVLTQNGVASPALFGVADCTNADIFEAKAVSSGTVTTGAGVLNTSAIDFGSRYTASPAGQTVLYRAEAVAYYVANGANGQRSLFRARFTPAVNGTAVPGTGIAPEELVEGIETIQLVYGRDQSTDVTRPTGHIGFQDVASTLTTEPDWRRVGQVRIGVVAASPDASSAADANATTKANLQVVGVTVTRPTDRRYRAFYDATVALRNRLASTN